MKFIVPNALVNIVNCFRVQSDLDYAKDTLIKGIVNDELIVGIHDIKATSHNVFVQDKVVAVIAQDDDEIHEVITVHLVKLIVPFFLEHQSVLDRSDRSRIAQLLKCFISNP